MYRTRLDIAAFGMEGTGKAAEYPVLEVLWTRAGKATSGLVLLCGGGTMVPPDVMSVFTAASYRVMVDEP